MRIILSALLLTLFTGSLKAQSAEELAKTFLQHYNELADGSYEKNYKRLEYGADTVKEYEVPPILGANTASLFTNEEGKYYRISFLKSNKQAKGFSKAALKAFKLIADEASYKLVITDKYTGSILKNGREIMSYFIPDDVIYNEYIFLYIQDLAALKPVLADEARYAHRFPTVPLVSREPQMIIKVDSLNSNKYELYNGIFKNGILVKGYQQFAGYTDFLNGTWYSDRWYYGSDALSTDVIFIPEGTTDSIYGHLNYNNFYNFYPSSRYDSKKHASSFADNAPLWLRTTYEKHLRDAYNEKYIQENSVSYDEMKRQSEATQKENQTQGSSGKTGASVAPRSSFSKCTVCNGKGYTEYDCGQGGGKPCRKYCSACNGTGQVHN